MTFNDKRFLLVSVARRYASYRYEIDELINEAWLDENVQKQAETGRFWMAARWAMLNYMRIQEKRGRKKHHIQTTPLIADGGDEYIIEPEIAPFNNFDYTYDFAWLCKGLTYRQKLVVRMRLEGFEWKEIAQAIGGVSKQYPLDIWKKAIEIVKNRYEMSARKTGRD
jgi:hypothetical protein